MDRWQFLNGQDKCKGFSCSLKYLPAENHLAAMKKISELILSSSHYHIITLSN
jgi:hypothetical protein